MAEIGALTGASAIIDSIRSGRGSEARRLQARDQLAERLQVRKQSSDNLRETRNTKRVLDEDAISRLLVDKRNAEIDQNLIDRRDIDNFRAQKRSDTTNLLNSQGEQNLQQVESDQEEEDQNFLHARSLSSPEQENFLTQQRLNSERQSADDQLFFARQVNASQPEQSQPRGSIVDLQA